MHMFVDDIICICHDELSALEEINHFFKIKPGSIGDPDVYIGAKVQKMTLPNGVNAWAMSPSKYVQEATCNFEDYLEKNFNGHKLVKKAATPFERD